MLKSIFFRILACGMLGVNIVVIINTDCNQYALFKLILTD